MSFDPQREDYQRLGLRFAREFKSSSGESVTHAFSAFGRRFAQDRDSLPQTDEDRAFRLVVKATQRIDYELPFATEERAVKIIEDGHRFLDEAIALDAHCYDAIRMKAAASNPSFDEFLAFLNDNAEEVRAYCESRRDAVDKSEPSERVSLASNIAMRPYFRWVAAQAEQALICGRNLECLRHAQHGLEIDPSDGADVRFTAAYAYAKLEDGDGLESFVEKTRPLRRSRPTEDGWTLMARLAIAYKEMDYDKQLHWLHEIFKCYPYASQTLIRQNELADGVFSRLAVAPYSEDELILAVSEGAVLLQEGVDPSNRGTMGAWVAEETAHEYPEALLSLIASDGMDDLQIGGEQ